MVFACICPYIIQNSISYFHISHTFQKLYIYSLPKHNFFAIQVFETISNSYMLGILFSSNFYRISLIYSTCFSKSNALVLIALLWRAANLKLCLFKNLSAHLLCTNRFEDHVSLPDMLHHLKIVLIMESIFAMKPFKVIYISFWQAIETKLITKHSSTRFRTEQTINGVK